MHRKRILFETDGAARWAGMGDFVLVSPDTRHAVELRYAGEPPHGDSYHDVTIDSIPFPGHAWGCLFGFSPCSRFVVFSWMPKPLERCTVAVDMEKMWYFVLPEYIYEFAVWWPSIIGTGSLSSAKQYTFSGQEEWLSY